jgi:hypothetical protein
MSAMLINSIAGYASIIFFGLLAFYFIRKPEDNKPGITLNNQRENER